MSTPVMIDRGTFTDISRRALLAGSANALALVASPSRLSAQIASGGTAPTIRELVRDPLLVRTLHRLIPESGHEPNGAAGRNMGGAFNFIEYQRQGAEWIARGVATGNPGDVALGWRILDYGLQHQQPDGGFPGGDVHHSATLYLEGLSRAMLTDSAGATPSRKAALVRAIDWMQRPEVETEGRIHSAVFTHRRYVLAATLGQTAAAMGDEALHKRARAWAEEGLAMQRPDGTNPERGGFDASYQMAGVMLAEHYMATVRDPRLRERVAAMIRRAVPPVLARQKTDGTIDTSDSTRVGGQETHRGKGVKGMNYRQTLMALAFGSRLLGEPGWRDAAARIAASQNWA